MKDPQHPLTGIRVLEMGSRVAAPYVGKLLADAGADVCKVESPAGDPFRRWSASGATIPIGGDAAWFRFLNGGKRSAVVDLGVDGGRDELLHLVAGADLVIDDHDPVDARALGITADEIQQVVALSAGTVGMPCTVACFDWVQDVLEASGEDR